MSDALLEELPAPARVPAFADEAARARANPRKWVRLGDGLVARSTASHIQAGRYAAFRPVGQWQASHRYTQGSRAVVWVRFLGKRGRR